MDQAGLVTARHIWHILPLTRANWKLVRKERSQDDTYKTYVIVLSYTDDTKLRNM